MNEKLMILLNEVCSQKLFPPMYAGTALIAKKINNLLIRHITSLHGTVKFIDEVINSDAAPTTAGNRGPQRPTPQGLESEAEDLKDIVSKLEQLASRC